MDADMTVHAVLTQYISNNTNSSVVALSTHVSFTSLMAASTSTRCPTCSSRKRLVGHPDLQAQVNVVETTSGMQATQPRVLLGTEAPVMTPNGIHFSFLVFLQATHIEGSFLGGVQQGLQALAVQAVGFPEVVDVQAVRHSCPTIGDAEEVPLCVAIGATVRGQPQLILLPRHLPSTTQLVKQHSQQ